METYQTEASANSIEIIKINDKHDPNVPSSGQQKIPCTKNKDNSIIRDPNMTKMSKNSHGGKEQYQLALHATDLPNERSCLLGGKICPYASVRIVKQTSGGAQGKELFKGDTEVMNAAQDPDWVKTFIFEFDPNHDIVNIHVDIMDYRLGKEPATLGSCKFEAGSVFHAPGKTESSSITEGRRSAKSDAK